MTTDDTTGQYQGPAIRPVQRANGVRYRATVNLGTLPGGQRHQRVITGDTREQVADQVTRLAGYVRPRPRPDVREVLEARGLVPAPVLCAEGNCTPMCLFALEDRCECRCAGAYHGRLAHLFAEALVDTGTGSAYPPPPAPGGPVVDRSRLLAHHGLRAVRLHAGLAQTAVARATGGVIHPGQLGRAERGQYVLSLAQLLAVAEVLDLGRATLDDVAAWHRRAPAADGRLAGGHVVAGAGQARR